MTSRCSGSPARRLARSPSSSATPAIARCSTSTSSAAITPGSLRSSSKARYPGRTAMFVAGCGGDQNPIPRRSLELAESYGRQLASDVEASSPARCGRSNGASSTAYEEIPSPSHDLPTREQIEKDATIGQLLHRQPGQASPQTSIARGRLEPTYPYPVAGLATRRPDLDLPRRRGRRRLLAADQAQPRSSSHTWVSAYCNDVMAYIPSKRGAQGRRLRRGNRDDLLRPALAVVRAGGGIERSARPCDSGDPTRMRVIDLRAETPFVRAQDPGARTSTPTTTQSSGRERHDDVNAPATAARPVQRAPSGTDPE